MLEMKICDNISIKGDAQELAVYTAMLLWLIKKVTKTEEEKEAQKELELLEKFGNMTFEDLLKREREDTE